MAGSGLLSACGSADESGASGGSTGTAAGGSSAGGKAAKVTLGFIPLTDCAPLVIAKEKGFFADHGVDVTLENGKSWPGVRDKLLNGEFAAAHCLYSMPLSVATGVSKIEGSSDKPRSLRIAMMLSQNGQGITLASDLADAGYGDLDAAKAVLEERTPKSLAMTFPGGTHDLWLRYWLKAMGIDPVDAGIEIKPVPHFMPDQSSPDGDRYVFAYTITITNVGRLPAQLISRHWIITDANDNPTKQVADIQDLIQRGVDILIVRPATEAVDSAVVRATKAGIPVVLGAEGPKNVALAAEAFGADDAFFRTEEQDGLLPGPAEWQPLGFSAEMAAIYFERQVERFRKSERQRRERI